MGRQSGAYTDVVTISLIANPTPTSFNQAYALAGKTKSQAVDNHYYYTMQDMNKSICDLTANEQQTTLVDIRDNKTYTIFKSKAPDSKCWMNQNLDLDLSSSITLTNQNTDLNSVDSWTPESPNGNTIAPGNLSSSTWANDNNNPYSYDTGDVYYYTSGDNTDDTIYNSLDACKVDHTEAECKHYHAGNYYNFSAAVASNDTSASTTQYTQMPNSICPKSWRLPEGPLNASDYSDFNDLLATYGIINSGASGDNVYLPDGFNNLRIDPIFIVRSGIVNSGSLDSSGVANHYWYSNILSSVDAYRLGIRPTRITPQGSFYRHFGLPIRCLADSRYEYSLNYNPNGTNVSNLPTRQTARSADPTYSFTASANIPTRTDYNFLGYATSPNGEVVYQPGAIVSVSNTSPTTTLYAKWGDNLGFNNSGITTMQAMTSTICSAASKGTTGLLQDTRDDKVYSILKANDNRCWMTQNLDLDLSTSTTLVNTTTDLNSVNFWIPERSTIAPGNLSSFTWVDDSNNPYSYDPGYTYSYTSNTNDFDVQYSSLAACVTATSTTAVNCKHYHAGNYYNFSAAVASNDTSASSAQYTQMPNSICPKGWRLPQGPLGSGDYSDFNDLLVAHGIINNGANGPNVYLVDGFNNLRLTPLFMSLPAHVSNHYGGVHYSGHGGYYHSSIVYDATNIYLLAFDAGAMYPQGLLGRYFGFTIRCVAR